jgi:tRNA-splicing ligase RtcB
LGVPGAPPRQSFQELGPGPFLREARRSILDEEISEADKDVSGVVEIAHGAGIAKKVAKLKPMGVIKG